MTKVPQILLVDDEFLLLMDMRAALETEGFVVHEAANSLAAFELLQRHPKIALVVTDIGMPGEGDGRALAHYIRQSAPDIAIIVVSGLEVAADELPADNVVVMSKPVRIAEFVRTVKELVPAIDSAHAT